MPSLNSSLIPVLSQGVASAAELARLLGVSQPTLSRALAGLEREGRIVRTEARRGARYGLRRPVADVGSEWPVHQVGESGALHELGRLYALERNQYFFDSPRRSLRGLSDGLPYFLQDARPAGFMGRTVPRAYPELRLPDRVMDWTDDHFITYLTQRGSETLGDLITGASALDHYLQALPVRRALASAERADAYPRLAAAAMTGTPAGSSAHGEHPKFTALLSRSAGLAHMLVKFSPPRDTRIGQRWSDLLVAEHLAHEILGAQGISACISTVLEFADRTYLEIERFDRAGAEGRHGVVSLLAVDTARYGQLDTWIASAERLEAQRLISRADLQSIRLISCFGELIGNTDRHFGNLSFFDRYTGRFSLAPVYDMLPMLFAPQNDQIVERELVPPAPSAATLAVWPRARALAEEYWQRLRADPRISEEFRSISARCLRALAALPRSGVFRPPAVGSDGRSAASR